MSKKEKLLTLITLCKENGLEFASLYQYTHSSQFIVMVHDPKLAGRMPRLEHMRDEIDWHFAVDAWYKRGLDIISVDENPEKAIELAIEYLQKQ